MALMGNPQKQYTSLQNRKVTFFHTDIYSGPDGSLCQKANWKHKQANLYIKLVRETERDTHNATHTAQHRKSE